MGTNSKVKDMVLVALLAALMAIVSPHPVALGPIPFTLGVFGVAFAAAMLPPAQACTSLAVYIFLGAIGLPVFSGYRGGPQVLLGPTGGYIVGYFVLVLAISLGVRHAQKLPLQLLAGSMGLVIFYILGTLWYMYVTGASFFSGLVACVFPFVLPDLAKVAIALALAREVRKRLHMERRSA